jgi:hypothetical protein
MMDRKHPLAGLCYVLTEAFYHMHGKRLGLKPVRARYYGVCHWWLETRSGRVIDLTAAQFTRPYPYHKGIGGGFLTKQEQL